jgi:hypothetical protein
MQNLQAALAGLFGWHVTSVTVWVLLFSTAAIVRVAAETFNRVHGKLPAA